MWWSTHSRLTTVMGSAWLQLMLPGLTHLERIAHPRLGWPRPNTIILWGGGFWRTLAALHLTDIWFCVFFGHLVAKSKIYATLHWLKLFVTLLVLLTKLSERRLWKMTSEGGLSPEQSGIGISRLLSSRSLSEDFGTHVVCLPCTPETKDDLVWSSRGKVHRTVLPHVYIT